MTAEQGRDEGRQCSYRVVIAQADVELAAAYKSCLRNDGRENGARYKVEAALYGRG